MGSLFRTTRARSQNPESRSQNPGARIQKSGARSQNPESRRGKGKGREEWISNIGEMTRPVFDIRAAAADFACPEHIFSFLRANKKYMSPAGGGFRGWTMSGKKKWDIPAFALMTRTRSQESGVRSQNPEVRIQKSESRIQKPEARSQEPEARSQEPESRSQEPESRRDKGKGRGK